METEKIARVIGQVLMAPVKLIRPMNGQPRKHFDQEKLKEFATDLKEQGQLQPAIVKEIKPTENDPYHFEIISGERRWRACQLAGIPELKIIIRSEISDAKQFEEAVIANNYGVELTLLENALAVGRLKHEFGKSVEEISRIFGKKSGVWAYMHLRILTLAPNVLKLLGPETPEEKRIPLNTAIILIDLPQDEQIGFAEMSSEQGLSAIQLRHLVRNRLAQCGIKRKSRLNEEFKSALNFFRTANRNIEQFVDHTDERVTLLLKNRTHAEVQELLRTVTDCADNLRVALKAFKEEAEKKFPQPPLPPTI